MGEVGLWFLLTYQCTSRPDLGIKALLLTLHEACEKFLQCVQFIFLYSNFLISNLSIPSSVHNGPNKTPGLAMHSLAWFGHGNRIQALLKGIFWYLISYILFSKRFLLVVLYSVHLLTWFGDEVNSLNLQDNGEWTAWSGKWGCSIWGETFSFLLIFAFLIFSFSPPAEWKIWKEWPIQLKMES